MKDGVLRNFAKRTQLVNQLDLVSCNLVKKETLAQMFSCEFCEISKDTFFTEHLWVAALFVLPKMQHWTEQCLLSVLLPILN